MWDNNGFITLMFVSVCVFMKSLAASAKGSCTAGEVNEGFMILWFILYILKFCLQRFSLKVNY